MKTISTEIGNITGQALEWAISEAESLSPYIKDGFVHNDHGLSVFTSSWDAAGALMDRHDISVDSMKGRSQHVKCQAIMDAKNRDAWGMTQRVSAFGPNNICAIGRVVVKAAYSSDSVLLPLFLQSD